MGGIARPVVGALLLWAALAIVPGAALAAPGDLDASFASGGVYTAPFMTTFPGAEDSQSVAVDSLGRVYLSATEEPQLNGGPIRHVKVVRLTSAGAPDATFGLGGTGTVTLPLPTTDVRNAGIVVDTLDRPVILVNQGSDARAERIGLVRLTTAGQPDPTFDGDGVATGPTGPGGWNTFPAGLAIDANGDILVVGTLTFCNPSCTKHDGFVTQFGPSGAQNTSYGTSGWTEIAETNTQMSAIQALPGGGAVVAGFNYDQWIVARLTAAGAPDGTFGTVGVARSSLGKASLDLVSDYGLTVDGSGRPIVVGQLSTGGATALVARWTSAGVLDPSFGTGTPVPGVVKLPDVNARGEDAAVQCDGEILVLASGSFASDNLRNRVLLARLGDDGALDSGFAPGSSTPGIGSYKTADNNAALDLALAPAGAYAAGFRRDQSDADSTKWNDAPQAMRFVAGEGCGGPPPASPPADPPVGDPPAATPPASAPAPPPPPAAAPALKVADLVAFPSTHSCASRRRFPIRLRVPKGSAVRQAVVKVNGRRVAVRKGDRLRSTVNLTKLPRGRFKVTIQLTLAGGRTISGTRAYRTCAVKRAGTKPKV